MKIKLEALDAVTILQVTEEVTEQHSAVLKAGVQKLLQSGKKKIILDLTGVPETCADALYSISSLQQAAAQFEADFIVASTLSGIGQANSREDALKMLDSVLFNLTSTEAKLQAKRDRLQARMQELNAKLAASTDGMSAIKLLRKENAELANRIKECSTQIDQLLGVRVDLPPPGPLEEKKTNLHKILKAVLEQEGMIPVT